MINYEKYKPSDLIWLSQIPNHWEIMRVKDLGEYQSGEYINANEFDEGNQYPVYGGNSFRGFASKFNVDGEYILIGRQGALCGNINYGSGKFWATEHCVVVYHKRKINFKWLGELLRVMNLNQYATSTAQPGLSVEKIKRLELPYPPSQEQIAIAQYLDTKTQAIDKKINLLTQKAETYKELRKSIINDAVCKGLDATVKLKESGIEWIGEIPEHWKIMRGKNLFIERSIKNYPEEPLLAASQKYGVVLKSMLDTRSMEAQKDFENFKLVNIKDFVISLRSFEGGFEMALYKGIISPVYTVFSVNKNLLEDYYKHLFKSVSFISNLKTMVTGIRDGQSIKFVEIQNTFFPIPPKQEQTAIASYLDEKTQKIDAIVSNIGKQIDTLKELRKTLINDVVTGKMKVTD